MTRINEQEVDLFSVFRNVFHPGNNKLLRSDGLDDGDITFLYDYENKSWKDISPDELSKESACLSALSDEGLLFIIPAYIRMFIDERDDDNGWIDRLLSVFANKGRGNLSLNREQFDVIDRFFLTPVKSAWEASRGSCFGDNLGELVDAARSNYSKY